MSSTKPLAAGVLTALLALTLLGSHTLSSKATLTGLDEVPPVVTETTGKLHAKLSPDGGTMDVKLDVKDARGILGAAGAHLHCAPVGVNGPVVAFLASAVPGGHTGRYKLDMTLTDANIVNPNTSCGATIAELADAIRDGLVYANVHSTENPSGEVRGQLGD